jgi:hypothetical protein
MSGGTRISGIDFPEDLSRSIVLVASRCDRFWCETGAVIAPVRRLRLRDSGADALREEAGDAVGWGPALPLATGTWLPERWSPAGRFVHSQQCVEPEDVPFEI